MKHLFTKILAIIMLVPFMANAQGVTSSSISGKVLGSDGKGAIGAVVVAIHIPSNSKYGGRTSSDGTYNINGLRVGGPYTIKASIIGSGEDEKQNVFLKLGSNGINFKLNEKQNAISEVVVSAKSQAARGKTGSETSIGKEQISNLPTLSRDFKDFTRLTPEANITSSETGGTSIGGQNTRMNAIYIDGAVNNDVFGLAESGTNGGQAGSSPFSLDAIESFTVQTAPYDVRQGGFAGGTINAVTRSGTNEIEGSAYMYFRNQDIAGTTPATAENLRTKLSPFTAETYGFRIGLPLQKDKIFLFTNVEYTKEQTPLPFYYSSYIGTSKESQINSLINKLSGYGFNPGIYSGQSATTTNWKFIGKLDFNLSEKHKFSIRYSMTDINNNNASNRSSNATSIVFSSNFQNQPSLTHSLAAELNSTLSDKISNSLVFGYTNVIDDRGSSSQLFPQVSIKDGSGNITFGTEAFSSINLLKQRIYSLTDNVTYIKGKHNITFGTHNEFYDIFNSFVGNGLGSYSFNSLNDFMNNKVAATFTQSYSIVDNVRNDNTKAAAAFKALQLGFYVQDEYQISDKLKMTLGVRADIPIYLDNPITNNYFNDSVIPKIEKAGYDLAGARIGQMPSTSIHFSPRLGFNYDVKGDASFIIRGGTGIFTSRIPFVWMGGLYSNSGNLQATVLGNNRYTFNPNPEAYIPASTSGTAAAAVDLIEKDFKLPQFWKTSFGIDKKLPWSMNASFEASFTKTLNNYMAENMAKSITGTTTGIVGSDRPYYGSTIDNRFNSYTTVIKNTGLGYAWNTSITLGRNVKEGFSFNVGYTYGVSKVGQEPTSSQNQSNWRYMENTQGRNNIQESYSDFDMGHRIFGSVGFRKEYFKSAATGINFFVNGQSGRRFSWIAGGLTASNEGGSATGVDLLYVPKDLADAANINFVANGTYTAAQQRQDFIDYIEQNDYLKENKGKYVERNGDRLPFQFSVDLRLTQEFFVKMGKKKQSFELTLDIFNFTNFINNDWGMKYFVANDAFSLINVTKNSTGATEYQFQNQKNSDGTYKDFKSKDLSGVYSSRWQGQFGLRYNF